MNVIRIEDNHKSFPAGQIRRHKDYYIIYFNKRPLWILLRNIYYEENMQAEFPNEHYKSRQQVPIYSIMKKSRKIGAFFARTTPTKGNDFLFCPKNRNIKKDYYIWDLKDKHIIRDQSNLLRLL